MRTVTDKIGALGLGVIIDRAISAALDTKRQTRKAVHAHVCDEGTSFGTLGIGLFVGVAVGAIAALLLAPRPGAQIREDLSETLDTGWDTLRSKVSRSETPNTDTAYSSAGTQRI